MENFKLKSTTERGRIYPYDPTGMSPPQFGLDSPDMKSITIPLDNARTLHKFNIGGNVLWAARASSIGATVDVRFNDQRNDDIEFTRGFAIMGSKFSCIYVTNTAQAGESITLIYSVEQYEQLRFLNPDISYTEIELVKATTLDSSADIALGAAAQTLIMAANANRRSIIVKNLAANLATIRVGDVGAAAAEGHELAPGESIQLDVTAAVYAWNPGAVAQSVSVVEIED